MYQTRNFIPRLFQDITFGAHMQFWSLANFYKFSQKFIQFLKMWYTIPISHIYPKYLISFYNIGTMESVYFPVHKSGSQKTRW